MKRILLKLHTFAQQQSLAVYLNITILGYLVLALLYGLYYGGAVGFVAIQLILIIPIALIWFFYIEFLLWIVRRWSNVELSKRIGYVMVFFLYSLTVIFTIGLFYLTYS